jgi:hypothetical protein
MERQLINALKIWSISGSRTGLVSSEVRLRYLREFKILLDSYGLSSVGKIYFEGGKVIFDDGSRKHITFLGYEEVDEDALRNRIRSHASFRLYSEAGSLRHQIGYILEIPALNPLWWFKSIGLTQDIFNGAVVNAFHMEGNNWVVAKDSLMIAQYLLKIEDWLDGADLNLEGLFFKSVSYDLDRAQTIVHYCDFAATKFEWRDFNWYPALSKPDKVKLPYKRLIGEDLGSGLFIFGFDTFAKSWIFIFITSYSFHLHLDMTNTYFAFRKTEDIRPPGTYSLCAARYTFRTSLTVVSPNEVLKVLRHIGVFEGEFSSIDGVYYYDIKPIIAETHSTMFMLRSKINKRRRENLSDDDEYLPT